MQFKFKKRIGKSEIEFTDEAESHVDFFKKVAFYASLPETTPSGSDDLEITHRTTTQGYHYFSLVSKSEKIEYKLGQSQKNIGSLYGTSWEPLYENSEQSQSLGQPQPQGLGQPQPQGLGQAQPQSVQQPQPQGLGVPQPMMQTTPVGQNVTQANPQFPGTVAPVLGPTSSQPQMVQPQGLNQPQPTMPQHSVQTNPQVQQQANDILSKFLGGN